MFRVGAPFKYAVDAGEIVSADGAVWVGIVEAINIATEKKIVAFINLVVEAEGSQPTPVVPDKLTWS